MGQEIYGKSLSSALFHCEPTTALKHDVYLKSAERVSYPYTIRQLIYSHDVSLKFKEGYGEDSEMIECHKKENK